MDIGRTEGAGGPQRVEPGKLQPARAPEAAPILPSDRLDIVDVARLITEAIAMPSVRNDRIAEIKRQIDGGAYQTDAKLTRALENFVRENDGI
jgi:negative regulator of flagellin synthesis FlgM